MATTKVLEEDQEVADTSLIIISIKIIETEEITMGRL